MSVAIFGGYFKPHREQDGDLQDTHWGKVWMPAVAAHPQQSTQH